MASGDQVLGGSPDRRSATTLPAVRGQGSRPKVPWVSLFGQVRCAPQFGVKAATVLNSPDREPPRLLPELWTLEPFTDYVGLIAETGKARWAQSCCRTSPSRGASSSGLE